MDILLVNPDHGDQNNFPWGVLAVGSYLKNVKNYEVEALDASLDGEEAALEIIKQKLNKTKVVGFTSFSSDIPFVKKALDKIKEINPECLTLIGGPHTSLLPEQTAAYKNADIVMYGDGEDATNKLLEKVLGSDKRITNFDDIPGIVYEKNGELVKTEQPENVDHFDIDYTLLDKRVQNTLGNYIQLLSGRGCSYRCTFCYVSITSRKWRGFTDGFFSELKNVVDKYNPKTIYFRDEHFFHDKKRIPQLIEFYKKNNFNFKWRATIRAGDVRERYVNQDLLKELEEINCECLKFGIESGSDKILKMLRKGLRAKHTKEVVDLMAKFPKINLNVSFLIGVPGENRDDYSKTLKMCSYIESKVKNLTIIGPQYYRIYPGGQLYNSVLENYEVEVPKSFEEWEKRYTDSRNTDEWIDTGIFHPWIQKNDLFLTQNAFRIIQVLTFDDKGLFTRKLVKCLLYPLKLIIKLRIKYGFYDYFVELVMFKRIKNYVRNMPWFRTNILGNVEIRKIKSDAVFAERVGGKIILQD